MGNLLEIERTLWDIVSLGDGFHCPYEKRCLLQDMHSCHHLQKHFKRNSKWLREATFCQLEKVIGRLATLYLERSGVSSPPVPTDIVSITDPDTRVELQLVDLKAHHGCLWFLGDEWLIQLNVRDSQEEIRYTLFHEVFHILCNKESPSFKRAVCPKPLRRPFYELVADYFSSCVLLPHRWVFELWPGIRDSREMAQLFAVSKQVMENRLMELGLLTRRS